MQGSEGPSSAYVNAMLRVPISSSEMTTVCYDHVCAADLMGWKREPRLMLRECVCIDRLHYVGHVACSPGYSIGEYRHDPVLSRVNSIANEQFFSFLDPYKPSLRYLGTQRLMLLMQYLVHAWNARRPSET